MNAYRRHEMVTVPAIRVALVLSILVHAAALFLVLPKLRTFTPPPANATSRLAVQLVPQETRIARAAEPAAPAERTTSRVEPAAPPVVAPPPRAPEPRVHRPPSPVKPRVKPPPPPIAKPQTAVPPIATPHAIMPPPVPEPPALATAPPAQPPPAPAPVAKPSPMPPAPAQDLAAYVEAQRRARGEESASNAMGAPATGESDIARRDRIVAANLGLDRTPVFGKGPTSAGGLFQIVDLGYDDARFYFFGFDKDIERNARQLIDVRRGTERDIRIAVVRRMIAIIREKIAGDFVWVSQRLGRRVTLSARPEDNAGLEDFILHDVFPDARVP